MFVALSSFVSFEDLLLAYMALVSLPLSKIRAAAMLFVPNAENSYKVS